MAQAILRTATPLLAAQAEVARMAIVGFAALALICAGQPLPL